MKITRLSAIRNTHAAVAGMRFGIKPATPAHPRLATLPRTLAGRRTHLRHLLAPLAVAAMLLGLSSNAGAQLAFPTGSGIGVFPSFALTLIYPPGVAITPTTLPAATGGTGAVTYALTHPADRPDLDASTRILTGTPVAATSKYMASTMWRPTPPPRPPARQQPRPSPSAPTGGVPAGNVVLHPSADLYRSGADGRRPIRPIPPATIRLPARTLSGRHRRHHRRHRRTLPTEDVFHSRQYPPA